MIIRTRHVKSGWKIRVEVEGKSFTLPEIWGSALEARIAGCAYRAAWLRAIVNRYLRFIMYTAKELLNLLPTGTRHVSTETCGDCTYHEFVVNGCVSTTRRHAPVARVRGFESWVPLSGVAGFVTRYCHI